MCRGCAAIPKLSNLEVLNLSDTKVTGEGLERFLRLQQLTHLNLSYTGTINLLSSPHPCSPNPLPLPHPRVGAPQSLWQGLHGQMADKADAVQH